MYYYSISALSAHLSADFDVTDWPGARVTVASAGRQCGYLVTDAWFWRRAGFPELLANRLSNQPGLLLKFIFSSVQTKKKTLSSSLFYFFYCNPGSFVLCRVPGKLKQFVLDLHSGKLHREFHHGPDPTDSTPGQVRKLSQALLPISVCLVNTNPSLTQVGVFPTTMLKEAEPK